MKKFFYILILAIGVVCGILIGKIVLGQFEEEATSTPEILKFENALTILSDSGGSTIFEDNFNSYIDGDLNGQDGWSGSATFDIQGTIYFDDGGTKAVENLDTSGNFVMDKTGDAQTDGDNVCCMRSSSISSYGGDFEFIIMTETTPVGAVGFMDNGEIKMRVGGDWPTIGSYLANTWYCIQMEWRSSDHYYRAKIGSTGTWTDWVAGYTTSWTALNVIRLRKNNAPVDAYWDYIAENFYEAPPPPPVSPVSKILDDVFFAINYIFGDLPLIYFAFLIVVGIVFSFIYQLTKR